MQKWLALLVLVIVLVGGGYYIYAKNQKPTELQKVTISQAFEVFLYAPLYVADAKGYFKDQGLEVTIATAGGDDKAFASLVSGDAQFAVGDPTFVAVAGEKGQPGKVVGAILNGVPFWGITKDPKITTITTPSQLGTNKVATFPAPSTAYALQKKMFESGGLKANIAQVAFGSVIPAVDKGEASIGLELEPNVSTATKNGYHIAYSLSQYYPDFAITGLTVLPAYAQQNPQTVQKVVNALQQADSFIRSHPQEAAAILAARFKDVPADVATNALKNIVSTNVVPADMTTSEAGWNAAIQLRKDNGDLKNVAPFTTYVDNTFANNAKSRFGN